MSDPAAGAIVPRTSLSEQLLAGQRRALARAISVVEQGGGAARALLSTLYPHTGKAYVLGVTGPPGAGKSTLVNEIALELRRRDRSVAIIAVDPTSPFTGGAVLGDRIRMQPLSGDTSIFIRSMAARGQLGGIARATSDVIKLFDAAGFETVIVETVGAGQAEVDVAREAHTTIVVEVPGLGDDVQADKAGILEIADIFVVNKADREGADKLRRHLHAMLQLGARVAGTTTRGWQAPILMTVAPRGEGVAAVVDAVDSHAAYLRTSGRLSDLEHERITRELRRLIKELALEIVDGRVAQAEHLRLVEEIRTRAIDPYTAAEQLLGEALGVAGPIESP